MSGLALRKLLAKSTPKKIRKITPKFISRHLYFKGTFQLPVTKKTQLRLLSQGHILENEMYWYGIDGGHEKQSMKLWMSYIQQFKPISIFDIGANTGIYGLVAQAIVPESKVTFFEPLPTAVSILQSNLTNNSFNSTIYQVALSDYDGTGIFNLSGVDDFDYSVTLNTFADLAILGTHDFSKSYRELKVKVCKLATLIKEEQLLTPKLIKLDVETSEYEVLVGMDEHIEFADAFLVEVLNSEQAQRLNRLFDSKNYEFFNIDDAKSTIKKYDEIVSTPHYNYFIAKKSVIKSFLYLQSRLVGSDHDH